MSNTVKLPTCPKCGLPITSEAPQGLCPKCVLLGAATGTEQGVPATATSEIPSIERIAAAFPQLEILELIGRGGMGFVFKARQPGLDRLVALKLLPDKLAKDASFTERFNREGRVLGRLSHPNIVSIYDFGQTGGFYYLLMEYVDGVNLRQAMRAGRFSPAEALAIVPKVCEALQYAHEQGVLHRDIKPENILLDARGRVKIADFGIAKLVDDSPLEVTLTGTGAALGTPHYMAPEQLEKPSTVDHRADIYSLGVVFYEMLTGELPIGRFAAPSSKTPVGANVDEVVFRTLEKDPGNRYQSAGEVQTRVQTLADEASAAENQGPASPPVGAPMGPHGTVVLGDAAPVKRPAQALLAAGIFNWVGSIVVVCLLAFTGLGQTWPLAPAEMGLVCLLILVFSSVIIVGALKMRRLEAYPLALSASVLAMITSPGSIIGLPIGLWALLTLRQPKVRAAFKGRSAHGEEISYSRWSIYGAMLVGLSLPAPMRIIVSMLTSGGGVGSTDLWIALGSVAMPGLGGTLLGWLGLNEIRENGGRVRGLPLAMFATLMWPLTIIGGFAVGVPMFLLVPGGEPTTTHTIGRFLVLLLPAGVITFAFWAIHATARWAGQQAPTQQRGVLKWVFVAILVAGMGVVMAIKPVRQVRYTMDPPLEGVSPSVDTAAVSPEKQAVQIRLARERLAEAQARFDAGLIPRLDVARLERDLAVAEAGDDAVALAGAKLKYADLALEIARQRFENGTTPRSELRNAEAERDLARIDLAEAMKTPGADVATSRLPIRANFRVAKGQAVTFEVVRGESENFAPVRGMAGFVIAPDDERGRFSVVLTPEPATAGTNQLRWRMSVINEDGSANHGASAELGELISMVPTNHLHTIEADSSFGLYLTRAYSTADTNGVAPLAELSLSVRSQPRGSVGMSPGSVLIGAGSTNWAQSLKQHQKAAASRAQPGEVLAYQWLKSPVGTNTTDWIRFTFTNVELRSENGQQWLGMGYVTDVRGDCEEVFRVDANGFKPVTRKTSWRTTPPDSPGVDYTGIQWLVPPGIDTATLESFRDSVAEALVGKSFVIPEGEQRPLLRFPIGKAGDLSVGIGAKRQLSVSAMEESDQSAVAPEVSAHEASGAATLQFRLVADDADTTSPADKLPEKQRGGGSITHRVLRAIVLDGSSVARAGLEFQPAGSLTIGVELNAEGARQFGAITTANLNRRLAIVADGTVLSAPIIRSPITGGEVQISGAFSEQEAYRLVKRLNRFTNELSFGESVDFSFTRNAAALRGSPIGLDLDAGSAFSWKGDSSAHRSWILTNGVDLMTVTSSGNQSFLEPVDLVTIPVSHDAWEALHAEDVRWHWTLMRTNADTMAFPRGALGGSGAFLFRTRELSYGLLEMIETDASAPTIKIRFKLVRPMATRQP